jgi:hypothetical protein
MLGTSPDGEGGLITGLRETQESWDFGAGSLALIKDVAYYFADGWFHRLLPGAAFSSTRFDELGQVGDAVWFTAGGADDVPTLCGWVPAARRDDLDGWLRFVNQRIEAQRAAHPSAKDTELEAQMDRARTASTLSFIRSLGVPIPQATTMSELAGRIADLAAADGPIAGRGKADPE